MIQIVLTALVLLQTAFPVHQSSHFFLMEFATFVPKIITRAMELVSNARMVAQNFARLNLNAFSALQVIMT